MTYNYSPNSYDYELLSMKKISYDTFLNMQLKYRESLENLLKKFVDFQKIDEISKKLNFTIPTLDDFDYNFYHKFSTLGSKYIFLRNNFHIERLDTLEIQEINTAIINECLLSEDFIRSTLDKVIFEPGTEAFFGVPIDKNKVDSNSLVFEFAYNDKDCTIEQGIILRDFYNKMFEALRNSLQANMNVKIEFIVSEGFDMEIINVQNDDRNHKNNEIR